MEKVKEFFAEKMPYINAFFPNFIIALAVFNIDSIDSATKSCIVTMLIYVFLKDLEILKLVKELNVFIQGMEDYYEQEEVDFEGTACENCEGCNCQKEG